MMQVLEDTYLGDVVRVDGKNSSNIQNRVAKGLGIISKIMNILETVSFGKSYFKIALSLREAHFLNGILSNSDVWYGVTKIEVEEIESVDRLLLRRILSVPESTCTEALYLETGCVNIGTILKGKRIKYLHYLVNHDKNSTLYKFFKAQWDHPVGGDWVVQCKQDLEDFGLPEFFENFEGKSKESVKKLVNKKSMEYALEKFLKIKIKHSKMDNLSYYELKMQDYLKLDQFTVEENKLILLWRLRMARFGSNYGDPFKQCPLCKKHSDTQENCIIKCEEIQKRVEIKFHYQEIFRNPTKEIVQVLKKVTVLRENQNKET